MFQLLFQNFWFVVIVMIITSAGFWRIAARDRIGADPSLKLPLNWLYGGFAFWLSLPFLLMGVGIVSGSVSDIFQYLTLGTGNLFITAFQGLLFAEDVLFIYWVFYRNGDHLLALHTEIVSARPKFRFAVRILAIGLPLLHGATLYYSTFSPHFGQFFGANGA